jgi:hypothetical protein
MYNVLCMGVLSSSLSATTCPGPGNNARSAATSLPAVLGFGLYWTGGVHLEATNRFPFPVISARSCVVWIRAPFGAYQRPVGLSP